MKGGVAGIVVAAEAIAAARPDATISLALVADEENASLGTDLVIAALRDSDRLPDAALVAEPTWLDLAAAHRGFAVVEVDLRAAPRPLVPPGRRRQRGSPSGPAAAGGGGVRRGAGRSARRIPLRAKAR